MIYLLKDTPTLGTADFRYREDIEVRSLRNLLGGQEYARSAMGHRLAGFVIDFSTGSASYTQTNDTSGQPDLSEFNPVVRPYRQDMTGHKYAGTPADTNPQEGSYLLEVQCYGQNLDLQATFYGLVDGADQGTSVGTVTVSLGSTAGWQAGNIILDLDNAGGSTDYQAYRVKVEALSTNAPSAGTLEAVEVWEPRTVWHSSWGLNQIYVHGDEWIGFPVTDGQDLSDWNEDGALRGWSQGTSSLQPALNIDGVRTSVHSVDFRGTDYMTSDSAFDLSDGGTTGFVFGCGFKLNTTGTNSYISNKRTSGGAHAFWARLDSADQLGVAMYHSGGSTDIYTSSALSGSTWYDLVVGFDGSGDWWVFLDGDLVYESNLGVGASWDEASGPCYLGAIYTGGLIFSGELALPTYIGGVTPTKGEVQSYAYGRKLYMGT